MAVFRPAAFGLASARGGTCGDSTGPHYGQPYRAGICSLRLFYSADGCVLEQRRADKSTDPGRIMIPGGHIEAGESQLQALQRELAEELGLQAAATFVLYSHLECSCCTIT